MDIYSPLRYPGGKRKIVNFIKLVFDKNDLKGGCYVEPYAGGASVALALLFDGYASKVVINDIDKSIYAFWYSVINDCDNLCKMIENTPISIEEWKKQKEIYRKPDEISRLDLGFSTFYLNRTNRSGILNAGVIGGLEQKQDWKIDARFNKSSLIKRIEKVAKFGDQIILTNKDACKLVKGLKLKLPENTLYYFDPPYYMKGKALYLNYYEHKDHVSIAKEIRKLNTQKWIVSYDNTVEIKKLYEGFKQIDYTLFYSAAKQHRMGDEVIIFSDKICLPKMLTENEIFIPMKKFKNIVENPVY